MLLRVGEDDVHQGADAAIHEAKAHAVLAEEAQAHADVERQDAWEVPRVAQVS